MECNGCSQTLPNFLSGSGFALGVSPLCAGISVFGLRWGKWGQNAAGGEDEGRGDADARRRMESGRIILRSIGLTRSQGI